MPGDKPSPPTAENVQVIIRCRPLNKTEKANGNVKIVSMDNANGKGKGQGRISVKSKSSEEPPKNFTFDQVWDETTKQADMYKGVAWALVENVIEGFNGTIFAYGQTGTGKTFSMEGEPTPTLKGVIPRAFDQVFESIDTADENIQFMVRASFLELYNEDVFDLLNKDRVKLNLKEDPEKGVYVQNLQAFVMKNVQETNELMQEGKKSRQVGATLMNPGSSRSHCIFAITVEQAKLRKETGEQHITVGKLNMVDLAGSERQGKTGATGARAKEGIKINLSLSALGNVIAALTSSKSKHIPYRDSKLTRLLQDSLGGNSKTCMIAAIGPADYNYDETISTLRFANRAKSIKNKPKINEDPKDAMLREFQDEISRLKAMLADEGLDFDPSLPLDQQLKKLPPKKVIIEKIEKKIVYKGVTKDKLKELEEKAAQQRKNMEEKRQKEKEELVKFKDQMKNKLKQDEEQIQTTEELAAKKAIEKKEMEKKLAEMQAQIMTRNKIVDKAKKKKLEIAKKEALMQRQRLEAERLQRDLEEKEAQQLELEKMYESQDKELAAKTKKLEKLRTKYQEIKQELDDANADNQREREELLETIRELTRHIQLKDLIATHFIPHAVAEKIESRGEWDEASEEWTLAKVDFGKTPEYTGVPRPGSARPGEPFPVTDFAKMKVAVGDVNPRWRSSNVLQLELDLPERTTQDYHELQNELRFQMRGGMPGGGQMSPDEDPYYRHEDPYNMSNSGPIY